MHVAIVWDNDWTSNIGVKTISGSVVTHCSDTHMNLLSEMYYCYLLFYHIICIPCFSQNASMCCLSEIICECMSPFISFLILSIFYVTCV